MLPFKMSKSVEKLFPPSREVSASPTSLSAELETIRHKGECLWVPNLQRVRGVQGPSLQEQASQVASTAGFAEDRKQAARPLQAVSG